MLIESAIMLNVVATTLMVITFSYLYYQYRQSYLAIWSIAWLIHDIRIILFENHLINQSDKLFIIFYLFLCILYSLFMAAGTAEFEENHIKKGWIIASLFCFFSACFGLLKDMPFQLYFFPTVFFVGTIYLYTGNAMRKFSVPGLGKYFTGWSFILLGLHTYDMPFLLKVECFTSWGYFIDTLLRFIASIGILLIYFEKVRHELNQKEKYYRILTENATDVIFRLHITHTKWRFEYISPAVIQLTGYHIAYFKNIKQILRLIHPSDRIILLDFIRNDYPWQTPISFRIMHKNGQILWLEPKIAPIHAIKDNMIIDGIIRDITARILLEQDVARLDRLNIAGEMAASLAHEIRNPLTTVRGYLQYFGRKADFDKYQEQISMLLNELDRTNQIISEYLSLNKNKAVHMDKANLNEIIQSIAPLIQTDAVCSGVNLVLELHTVPDFILDEKEIKQLLLNLTRNAIDAMAGGGKLTISTATNDKKVILSVTDTGSGIPTNIMNSLGKPFITNKENGTGLGLAICFRIASRHQAKINVTTNNSGTIIQVVF